MYSNAIDRQTRPGAGTVTVIVDSNGDKVSYSDVTGLDCTLIPLTKVVHPEFNAREAHNKARISWKLSMVRGAKQRGGLGGSQPPLNFGGGGG